MHLLSLEGCRLTIGSYPPFCYDASGGGGKATIFSTEKENVKYLKFQAETFSIPPLTSKTTKFLAIPLPPGLKIEMCMDKLEGTIDQDCGKVLLRFEARFIFSICSKYYFPNLLVTTLLETGKVIGNLHKEEGLIIQNNGRTTLVGIAIIPKTGNKLLDIFLNLPNEALAVLQCKITE